MPASIPPVSRSEVAANLRLALPLVVTQITFVGYGVADTLMAGRMGGRELAAIAVGSNIWFQLFILFMGICVACSPIVAQRLGAGQPLERIGDFTRQALVLALGMGLVWLLATWLVARPAIAVLNLSPETADLAYRYLLAESWGALLLPICFVMRNCAEGLGLTQVVLRASLFGLTVKIACNFWFVWGGAGLAPMGAVGFGWATVVAGGAIVLAYALECRWQAQMKGLQVFGRQPVRMQREAMEVFRLGIPIGLIMFGEVAFFGCTALLMARFGDDAVAAHQIAINAASLSFMVPVGIGMATAVRVGHAAGAQLHSEVAARGRAGIAICLAYSLFSASLMGFFPHWITPLYTSDAQLAAVAENFLRFAAIFQFFDCLQAGANGALRGIKDTRLPMVITLVAYWVIGMPASYALAFPLGYGADALWWGFILGLMVAALGLSNRWFIRTALVKSV